MHRSGGSMLSQLFDDHPEVYAHPLELNMWSPKEAWGYNDNILYPTFLGKSADETFNLLKHKKLCQMATDGYYHKSGSNQFAKNQKLPFSYSPSKHRLIFNNVYNNLESYDRASVVLAFLNSFFQAWDQITNHPRKYISAYLPHLWCNPTFFLEFIKDFPKSKIIFILRNPNSWLASAILHRGINYNDINQIKSALDEWRTSVNLLDTYTAQYNHIIPVVYEELVTNTKKAMQYICNKCELNFDDSLLTPTFAGNLILPNSSFNVDTFGVNTLSITPRTVFDQKIQNLLDTEYLPLYYVTANKYYYNQF